MVDRHQNSLHQAIFFGTFDFLNLFEFVMHIFSGIKHLSSDFSGTGHLSQDSHPDLE